MKENIIYIILLAFLLVSCGNASQNKTDSGTTLKFQNKGHELVYGMVNKVGELQRSCRQKECRIYLYLYSNRRKKLISQQKDTFLTESFPMENILNMNDYFHNLRGNRTRI